MILTGQTHQKYKYCITFFSLKGKLILAPDNVWGKKNIGETRPCGNNNQGKNLLSEACQPQAGNLDTYYFVRNDDNLSKNVIARTILTPIFQPRATLRLPWARIDWPFRPLVGILSTEVFPLKIRFF